MLNVLWLASWYPSRVAETNGDFVERHAIAVAHKVKLTVLVIVKDETLKKNEVVIDKVEKNGFVTYTVYYGTTGWGGVIEKFISFRKYLQLQKQLYHTIAAEQGKPDIVHVHVAMKAGLLALWLKEKFKIPFVVTEHWTGYYPDSKPNIYSENFLAKRLNHKILTEAATFLPVSNDLGRTVQKYFANINFIVVPNVVDTSKFFDKNFSPSIFRFIHPSYLNYQKNPEGIIESCHILKEKGYPFELLFVGNKDERLMQIAKEKGLLDTTICFENFKPHNEVAIEMQQSSALLLFSRFENLPCVILEALCCGLPVVSSDVGGIAEVVNESNGILVESENLKQLAEAMAKMIDQYSNYDRSAIAASASSKFNYDVVGAAYFEIYTQVLLP